jgi:hypothetical protein
MTNHMTHDEYIASRWERLVEILLAMKFESNNLTKLCREATYIRYERKQYENELFFPFVALDSDTDAYPVGEVRALWAQDSLEKMDREREATEARYRSWILDAAEELRRFAQAVLSTMRGE